MSDFVDRQAAIEVFEDTTFTKNEIVRRLSELPSVQSERKKGKWIGGESYWWHRCSVCGNTAVDIKSGFSLDSDPYDFSGENGHTTYYFKEFLSDYCPFCGADMRKEIEDAVH